MTGIPGYRKRREASYMWAMHVIIGSVLSQLQLYTANSTEGWLALSHANISNGVWHSVLVEKVGSTTIHTVDGEVEAEATAPTILRTNSPLYIGGVPSEFLYYNVYISSDHYKRLTV